MSAARTKITADEMTESLTGFDEIAIEKAFGDVWETLANRRPSTFNRALIFVHFTREGQNANEARKAALTLTLGQTTSFFTDEDDDPEDETGKDEQPPASEPTSSQPSASLPESNPANTPT